MITIVIVSFVPLDIKAEYNNTKSAFFNEFFIVVAIAIILFLNAQNLKKRSLTLSSLELNIPFFNVRDEDDARFFHNNTQSTVINTFPKVEYNKRVLMD